MQTELLIYIIVKALLELVALFLLGQGLLYLLAGQKREQNWFYQVFRILTSPVVKITRLITPKVIVDRHVPFVALLLVVWAWLFLLFWLLPEICSSGAVDCKPLMERKVQEQSS